MQLNRGDKDSGIQLSNALSKRSCQDCFIESILSTWKLACIKDKTSALANVMRSIFTFFLILKSYIHIVTVLANLIAGCDDFDSDEALSLEEAIVSPYWKDFEKTILAEF